MITPLYFMKGWCSVKKIMLVEDDPIMLASLSLLFGDEFIVEAYSNGEKALERLKINGYDLIITDLFLNSVTGFDLYNASSNKSAFIIITGYPDTEIGLKAKALLGDRFIVKSASPEVLKSKISEILFSSENKSALGGKE